jgi:hemerythrin-like domain-containing protein
MADAFDLIAADHDRILQLVHDLSDMSGAKVRRTLAERLVIEESKHEVIEELFVWPAVRDSVEGGVELMNQGLNQERQGKRLLNELQSTSAGNEEFDTLVRRLTSEIRNHITFEDSQVVPRLQLVLSDEMNQRLAALMQAAVRHAPTRPHPHTPPIPGLLKLVGPVVARLDRARDVIERRGRSHA